MREVRRRCYDDGFRRDALELIKAGAGKDTHDNDTEFARHARSRDKLGMDTCFVYPYSSWRPDRNGELIVIDTPPNGSVVDEAIKTADFVVIPTLSSPIDLQQTMLTAAQCQDAGKDYAVLIVMARKGTNALRAFRTAVEEYGAGIFDTEIPLREDFKADFGHTFRSNLNGYEDVWNELKEELR